MVTNLSNEPLGVEVSNEGSGNGTVHLELVTQFGNSDDQELWSLLDCSVVGLLVEIDCVVKLFLYLDLGP